MRLWGRGLRCWPFLLFMASQSGFSNGSLTENIETLSFVAPSSYAYPFLTKKRVRFEKKPNAPILSSTCTTHTSRTTIVI